MDLYSGYINQLIEQFAKLPGVGNKSAQRLALHIINMPKEHVERFAKIMVDAKNNIHYCKYCYTLTDEEVCPICANPKRDHTTIMVVENIRDLAAYEKTGKFEGVYHVLHGAISPMLGIGPGDIKLKELIKRLEREGSHYCNQFQPGRRDNSDVHFQADQTYRCESDENRQWCAGWRRSGMHR